MATIAMPPYGTMQLASEQPSAWKAPRLGRYISIGLLCGVVYALIDKYLDASLESKNPTALILELHHLVDLVLPLIAGALFGASAHVLQLRAARVHREARRADELRAQLSRLERDQAVWVVVASTLHEIKNPLHALGLLLAEVTELRADEQATRVELLQRTTQLVDRIRKNVEALRSLSTRAAPRPEPVELVAVTREVATSTIEAAHSSQPELSMRGVPRALVSADPAHLRLILENLIENAIEAVEGLEYRSVDLDIAVNGDQVLLRISDSGPGVAPELRGDLFEPLATSKARGLGLGLPIARALARAMGGDVVLDAESTPASTFVLSLPRVEQHDGTRVIGGR